MIKNTISRGFTLIELLVVIAIIGILAAVVLVSLNSARDKGEDAAIKQNLSGIRSQAAIYYDDNSNSYTGVCDTDSNVSQAVAAAGGICADTADTWLAYARLSSATSSAFCVDSTGKATTTAFDGITGSLCP